MAKLSLEIITGERVLFEETGIDAVIAPGVIGELGILPNHAPLVTVLQPGELRVQREGNDDEPFFVSGGFLEVHDDTVTVLADTAERGDEIDLERAEAARARAADRLRSEVDVNRARAQASMQRSLMRIRVGERRARRRASQRSGDSPSR